jgi:hypothetical protein
MPRCISLLFFDFPEEVSMPKVAIVTDSTAYIPQPLVEQYNISVAPLAVNWDGVSYH